MGVRINKYPLYILLWFSIFILIVFPIIYTVGTAIFQSNFSELVTPALGKLLGNSLWLSFSVSIIATTIGTVLAVILYKTNLPYRSFFIISLLIPLLISPYIFAVAWKDFFFLIFHKNHFMESYFGVVWVQSIIYTPLSMIIVGSSLSNMDASLEEAAEIISSRSVVLRKIVLPLIKPALLTSLVLVFIFSISDFTIPAFFGVKVFTTEIFTQFSAFYNHSLAILQSLVLIIICLTLLFVERKQISEAPFFSVGSKGFRKKIFALNQYRFAVFVGVISWLLLSVALPFFTLVYQSFSRGTKDFVKAFELLLPTFTPSILLAIIAALLMIIIGFTSAYFQYKHSKNSSAFNLLLLFSFAIPSTVFGISLIKFYNAPHLNFIYSTYAILLIGYIGKFGFIALKFIENAFKQLPKSFYESGQIMGISERKSIQKIFIPLVYQGVFAAFIISFIFSLGELGTSIMVYPPGTSLMPIKVFTIMANAPVALTASMSLIVFGVSLILIGLLYFGSGKWEVGRLQR